MDTKILEAIISVVTVALTSLVIPLLAKKNGTEKVKQGAAKFDSWTAKAEKVVDAAYQMFETNDERLAFAETTLTGLGVPNTALKTLIEAAVKTCKVAGTAIAAVKQVEASADAAIRSSGNLTVTYDANSADGGSAPLDTVAYAAGDTAVVRENTGSLTKSGSIFNGWNTAKDGSGVSVAVGAKLTLGTVSVTLYAVWVAESVSA